MSAAERSHRARYRRIMRFATALLWQLTWHELILARIGMRRRVERTRAARLQRHARGFFRLAIELGGLMIKVGQFLSSRQDVLPPAIVNELRDLQDRVPPVPYDLIARAGEEDLGIAFARAFAAIDPTPLAAASLGQAHRARLTPEFAAEVGFEHVVVKLQRPGIGAIVETDLAALARIAKRLSRIRFIADRVDAEALVAEFAHTSREEIDYLHEAASAERFARNAEQSSRMGAPAVVWERTSRRVLTLQDVTAIRIDDAEALRASGIRPAELANALAAVMFEQFFTHGFFHADPHPGNLFVTPGTGDDDWQITFIDFGMMGEVPPELREHLRIMLIAVMAHDSRGLVDAARRMGLLLPSADTNELEHVLGALFARFGGMGIEQLRHVDPHEFAAFAAEFLTTIRALPMQVPEGVLLLFRSMSLVSGLTIAIQPSFNMWDAVRPHTQTLMQEESRNLVRRAGAQALSNARILWQLPGRIEDLVTGFERGQIPVDTSHVERRLGRLERLIRRVLFAVIFAALMVGGVLLMPFSTPMGIVLMSASVPPLAGALFAGSGPHAPKPRRH